MNDIYAVYKYPNVGYPFDRELVAACNFKIGERYLVDTISVGQSSTSVWLSGYVRCFNSVHFDFENEDGESVDVYSIPEFNPYLNF